MGKSGKARSIRPCCGVGRRSWSNVKWTVTYQAPRCVSFSSGFSVPFFRTLSPLSPWEVQKRRTSIPPRAETYRDYLASHKTLNREFLCVLLRKTLKCIPQLKLSSLRELTFRILKIMYFCKNSKRHSTQETHDPQSCNYSNSSLQARHRVEMKRMTNRKKSLHWERDDGEHRDVSGSGR